MTPSEVRAVLDDLDRRLGAEIAGLWRATAARVSGAQFRRLLVQAYPGLVTPFAAAAAELGAVEYMATPTTSTGYVAATAPLPAVERLSESASWALATGLGEDAIALLTASATRALFDGFRDTVMLNADREPGARWARHASANACGWCRILATRHIGQNATFYASEEAAVRVVGRGQDMSAADRRDRAAGRDRSSVEGRRGRYIAGGRQARGSRPLGEKFHDGCHCTAIVVRPGQEYTPAPYVEQWNQDYLDAVALARKEGLMRGEYGAIDPNVIARLMDQLGHNRAA